MAAACSSGLLSDDLALTKAGRREVDKHRARLEVRVDSSESYRTGAIRLAGRIETSPAYQSYCETGSLATTKGDELFRALRLPPTTEEYIVAIAASVAKYFLRAQRAVGFISYGHQHEIIQPDRGERQLNRLLEVLAVLRAEGNINFGHVLGVESARLGRNNTLVAITPSPETGWVKSLRETKRRGLRMIAAIADVNTFGGHGDTEGVASELVASGIPTYVVREGDDLQAALSR